MFLVKVTNMNIDNPEYEICLCRRLKVADVERIIKETGARTLKELCEKGRVGDKCGGCREELEQLLQNKNVDF